MRRLTACGSSAATMLQASKEYVSALPQPKPDRFPGRACKQEPRLFRNCRRGSTHPCTAYGASKRSKGSGSSGESLSSSAARGSSVGESYSACTKASGGRGQGAGRGRGTTSSRRGSAQAQCRVVRGQRDSTRGDNPACKREEPQSRKSDRARTSSRRCRPSLPPKYFREHSRAASTG